MATVDGDKVHLFFITFLYSKMIFKPTQSLQKKKKKIHEFGFSPENPFLKSLLTHADDVWSLSTETSPPFGEGCSQTMTGLGESLGC